MVKKKKKSNFLVARASFNIGIMCVQHEPIVFGRSGKDLLVYDDVYSRHVGFTCFTQKLASSL